MCPTFDRKDPYPDGQQTIADLWVMIVYAFDTPGRWLVSAVLNKPKLATFFHVD